jgi:hypothetical protein
VADEDDRVAALRVAAHPGVHLRHERTGRVDDREPAALGRALDRGSDAVRGEHDRRALGHVLDALDEDRARPFEVADDLVVVDDLPPDVQRRAPLRGPFRTVSIARSTPAQ